MTRSLLPLTGRQTEISFASLHTSEVDGCAALHEAAFHSRRRKSPTSANGCRLSSCLGYSSVGRRRRRLRDALLDLPFPGSSRTCMGKRLSHLYTLQKFRLSSSAWSQGYLVTTPAGHENLWLREQYQPYAYKRRKVRITKYRVSGGP